MDMAHWEVPSVRRRVGEAIYDPVGPIHAASTTFESGVAFRVGTSGPRQFLTAGQIGGSGGSARTGHNRDPTNATSVFSSGGSDGSATPNRRAHDRRFRRPDGLSYGRKATCSTIRAPRRLSSKWCAIWMATCCSMGRLLTVADD